MDNPKMHQYQFSSPEAARLFADYCAGRGYFVETEVISDVIIVRCIEDKTMSDLSTGSAPDFPAFWGFPSDPYNYVTHQYTTCGMIWYGPNKATPEDIEAVKADPRTKSRHVDPLTLCGTMDSDWRTEAEILLELPAYQQSYKPGA